MDPKVIKNGIFHKVKKKKKKGMWSKIPLTYLASLNWTLFTSQPSFKNPYSKVTHFTKHQYIKQQHLYIYTIGYVTQVVEFYLGIVSKDLNLFSYFFLLN